MCIQCTHRHTHTGAREHVHLHRVKNVKKLNQKTLNEEITWERITLQWILKKCDIRMFGPAISKGIRCQLLITGAPVQSQLTSYEIHVA